MENFEFDFEKGDPRALGWVAAFRSIKQKGWYKDSHFVHLWMHLLFSARRKPKEILFNGQIVKIMAGQLITGRRSLSQKTGIEESKVERILKVFENEQQIEQQKTNKFRLITIKNWKRYQQIEQQIEQRVNNKRTTSEQQVNTNNKDNNDNKEDNSFSEEKKSDPILEMENFLKKISDKDKENNPDYKQMVLQISNSKKIPAAEIENLLEEFSIYWTEPFSRGKKLKAGLVRWQGEETWDVWRRLNYWINRHLEKQSAKNSQKPRGRVASE